MHSKNTQRLIESRPQWLKTVHKYSRTLILLFQPTTNLITPQASTLEKPELFTASTNATNARISRIFRITRIDGIVRIARMI